MFSSTRPLGSNESYKLLLGLVAGVESHSEIVLNECSCCDSTQVSPESSIYFIKASKNENFLFSWSGVANIPINNVILKLYGEKVAYAISQQGKIYSFDFVPQSIEKILQEIIKPYIAIDLEKYPLDTIIEITQPELLMNLRYLLYSNPKTKIFRRPEYGHMSFNRADDLNARSILDENIIKFFENLAKPNVTIVSHGSGDLLQEANITMLLLSRGISVNWHMLDLAYVDGGHIRLDKVHPVFCRVIENFRRQYGVQSNFSINFHSAIPQAGISNVDLVFAIDVNIPFNELKLDLQKLNLRLDTHIMLVLSDHCQCEYNGFISVKAADIPFMHEKIIPICEAIPILGRCAPCYSSAKRMRM